MNFNRRIFSWRPEQPLLLRSFLQKVYLCGFDNLNMLHTHTLYMFYFITDGYQNSIFCNIASIQSRDYDKSHRLKQRSLIGQPSLRTAVSQACPSGRIQGWYCRRPVATPVTRALTCFFFKFSLNKLLNKHSNFRWSETSWRLCALLWYL